jgi:hypothetical protein
LKIAAVDSHFDQLNIIAGLTRVLNGQSISCITIHATGILLLPQDNPGKFLSAQRQEICDRWCFGDEVF